MALKSLKMIFRESSLTSTDTKLVFVICKSASLTTGHPSLLLQPKLIWMLVLSSNYFLYEFNATRFQNFKRNFLDVFVLLVPLEIISYYPDIDFSHWLREEVQWNMVKVFREKLMV